MDLLPFNATAVTGRTSTFGVDHAVSVTPETRVCRRFRAITAHALFCHRSALHRLHGRARPVLAALSAPHVGKAVAVEHALVVQFTDGDELPCEPSYGVLGALGFVHVVIGHSNHRL